MGEVRAASPSRGEIVGANATPLIGIDGFLTLGESVVLSPDGETLLYVTQRHEEHFEARFIGPELYLLRPGQPEEFVGDCHTPVWAPDGRRFSCLRQTTHGAR